MADDIFVVRIVTVSSVTFEFYYKKKKNADEAADMLAQHLKKLERKTVENAPAILLVDLTDDYGIRQIVDVRGIAGIVHTNTKASAVTTAEIETANRKAQEKHGLRASTGFTPNVVIAQPPR